MSTFLRMDSAGLQSIGEYINGGGTATAASLKERIRANPDGSFVLAREVDE